MSLFESDIFENPYSTTVSIRKPSMDLPRILFPETLGKYERETADERNHYCNIFP